MIKYILRWNMGSTRIKLMCVCVWERERENHAVATKPQIYQFLSAGLLGRYVTPYGAFIIP